MTNAGVRGDSRRGDEAVEVDEVQERTSKCRISTDPGLKPRSC
jgi:hypothetical protein